MSNYISVSYLNTLIKSTIEATFSLKNLYVIGEVGSLTKHYTGHYYFTLKDESSQIKCMMFSSYTNSINFDLKNGDLVLINGYIGVYDKGGTYQLYCRSISQYGEGQYLVALEKLKQKLLQEGVFDKAKLPIPLLPKRIGLLTASTGAALHDFMTTIKNRMNVEVYFFPCQVQGENASLTIIEAIKEATKHNIDLMVITRGGGSKEDLKIFNDEALVREVASLNIPVISAVGHQIDTTLIDYVVSKVAITPTDAANASVASYNELQFKIETLINKVESKFIYSIEKKSHKLMILQENIDKYSPMNKLTILSNKINESIYKSSYLFKEIITKYYNKIEGLSNKVDLLNPLNKLDKGFVFATDLNSNPINSINELNIGDNLNLRFKDGLVKVEIKKIEEK